MLDTTDEMLQKQREIIFSKPASERFMIGVEVISFGRLLLENSIKQKKPDISELDLKIAVLKRYYENVFDIDELNNIIASLVCYYTNKNESTQQAV